MSKYLLICILSLIIISFIGCSNIENNQNKGQINDNSTSQGQKANIQDTKMPKGTDANTGRPLDTADVNGDGEVETIDLTSAGDNSNITLLIKDKNNKILSQNLISEVGVSPDMVLGDFDGDKVNDIFISIPSGGSGGDVFYWLITFKNNVYKEILIDKIQYNKYLKYEYKDKKVILSSDILNKSEEFALSDDNYNIYKELKSKNEDDSYFGPNCLEAIDYDKDNNMELKYTSFFNITYKYPVAEISIIFKYNNGEWIPSNLEMKSIDN